MTLSSETELSRFIQAHPLCAIYFSGPDCAVCESLKPKLFALLGQRFPQLELAEVDCALSPQLAAQHTVFSLPTLIIYLDGREGIRKVRNFSLAELAAELQRPYSIFTA
jgi:thioredoxin-like negative regulator of GroEL